MNIQNEQWLLACTTSRKQVQFPEPEEAFRVARTRMEKNAAKYEHLRKRYSRGRPVSPFR